MDFTFRRTAALLLGAVAVSWLPHLGTAEARSFSAGRTLGNSSTAIGVAPLLNDPAISGALLAEQRIFPVSIIAQQRMTTDAVVRSLEAKGFSKITGLMRRGGNYVFLAYDALGMRVRVVMNAETGEIVGLSPLMPRK